MADKQAGVYSSAISVLKRAIELDSANRLEEAVVCYQEGLQLLITYLKGLFRELYTLGRSFAILYKGDDFLDFLFSCLHTGPLLRKGLL